MTDTIAIPPQRRCTCGNYLSEHMPYNELRNVYGTTYDRVPLPPPTRCQACLDVEQRMGQQLNESESLLDRMIDEAMRFSGADSDWKVMLGDLIDAKIKLTAVRMRRKVLSWPTYKDPRS